MGCFLGAVPLRDCFTSQQSILQGLYTPTSTPTHRHTELKLNIPHFYSHHCLCSLGDFFICFSFAKNAGTCCSWTALG